MSILFSGSEIIDVAVGIENNGAAFYETLAKLDGEVAAQSVYKGLAAMERQHGQIFEGLRSVLGGYDPKASYAEEFDRYLKALVDSAIFRDDKTARQMAEKVTSDAAAIQIAIGAEKDSILFYSEMRRIVPKSTFKLLDRIINEERGHLRELSELNGKLADRQG
ncbi:MAG: ferritin family protein [Dehalococcoidia bacterium]|nr:ferritin family protein [Dehalococcoidia bacterium]